MSGRDLKNKPLVEALLEVKWALTPVGGGVNLDPHYKILLGRLYDRVSQDYPEHEQLPTATIPDEMVGQIVQHRFRHGPDDWPLLQIGPGILTLNDTHKYTWADFESRAITAVNKLFDAYPRTSELKIESLLLRYIDAVEFDYRSSNVFQFLRDKMKVTVALPDTLFTGNMIRREPTSFRWQSSFECQHPRSLVTVRFGTGQKEARPALLWETLVESKEKHVPSLPNGFAAWIDAAHTIADDWFFKLIEGDLERMFSGD